MHIAYIGQGLLVGALAGSAYGCIGRRHQRIAAWSVCLALLAAFGVLLFAHVTSDFSLLSVVKYSHTAKPMLYKISGVWGNHEGSMLLWTLILSLYTVSITRSDAPRRSTALTILSFLCLCFTFFLLVACDPFAPLATPAQEGLDLNPLLQDPALAVHPPFLYAGYVGFAVPFAWGLTTLLHRDAALFQPLYRSTLTAWMLLSIGLGLGAFWAYYELGWGGWWAWDPVENASLMPWLSGLVLLHTLQVHRSSTSLGRTCLFLSLLTFSFCLVGTLITRSGLLVSVHTFAVDPERGLILGGLCALILIPAALIFLRFQKHWSSAPTISLTNRSGAIAVGSILFLCLLGTIVVGTFYPLFAQWGGYSLSVGEGFFASTALPLFAPCLFLMGIALFLAHLDTSDIWRRILPRLTLSLAIFLLYLWIWPTTSVMVWVFMAGGIWVVVSHLLTWSGPNTSMILAHVGIGLAVIGATHSLHHEKEFLGAMSPGGSASIGPYTLNLTAIQTVEGPNYHAHQGLFSAVITPDASPRWLTPEKRFYWTQNIIHGETAILSDALSHLYLTLGDAYEGNQWSVRAFYKPGINLLWLGWALMIVGALWRWIKPRWAKRSLLPLMVTIATALLPSCPAAALEAHEVMAVPILEHRARLLYNSLRCPTCGGQSLADSPSETAEKMRSRIRDLLLQNYADEEITEDLTAVYGPQIMSTPQVSWLTSVLWSAPWIFLVLGFGGLYWRHRRSFHSPQKH